MAPLQQLAPAAAAVAFPEPVEQVRAQQQAQQFALRADHGQALDQVAVEQVGHGFQRIAGRHRQQLGRHDFAAGHGGEAALYGFFLGCGQQPAQFFGVEVVRLVEAREQGGQVVVAQGQPAGRGLAGLAGR
ncbi:hypothetical protein D3C78_1320680 [compost metagenome]